MQQFNPDDLQEVSPNIYHVLAVLGKLVLRRMLEFVKRFRVRELSRRFASTSGIPCEHPPG